MSLGETGNSIKVRGKLGIGTTAALSYPLEVKGSNSSIQSFWYPSEIRTVNYTTQWVTMLQRNPNRNVGIKVEKGILCDFICFSSDERIKEVIGVSNSKADLSTLVAIEVTDYKKKDKVQFGEQVTKKLIAQQVKTVFPEAVRLTKDIIPNIYELAEIKEGYIALETDLEKGDRVKLIFEDKEEIVEVIKTNKNGFFTDNKKEGKVFVYGKEVDDFHVVDYDAVSMLNVSATQELYKLILKQQQTIENQKTEIKAQTTQLELTKKNQSDFDERIKALENRYNTGALSK